MNDDRIVIAQMGLLLGEVGATRRALEGIRDETRRYASLAFSLSEDKAIGSPPMLNGALKVHVVNIGDIAATGPGLFEGVLGGIGRFIGGVAGGFVGGVVGGVVLPFVVRDLVALGKSLDSITARLASLLPGLKGLLTDLGVIKAPGEAPAPAAPAAAVVAAAAPAAPGAVAQVTDALTAAGSAPPGPPAWLPALQAVREIVEALAALVPIVTLALLSLFARLPRLQLALADLLAFAVESVLLLRGIMLVYTLETAAMAAQLASDVLGALQKLIGLVLTSLGTIIASGLKLASTAIGFLGKGTKGVADALLDWLYDGVGGFLTWIGTTAIVRLLRHIIQILPDLVPALAKAGGNPLGPDELNALTKLRGTGPKPGDAIPAVTARPKLADPSAALGSEAIKATTDALEGTRATVKTELAATLKAAQTFLTQVGSDARRELQAGPTAAMQRELEAATKQAGVLRSALGAPAPAVSSGPADQIVQAWETSMKAGGLDRLMDAITTHFLHETPAGPAGTTSLLGRLVGAAIDRLSTVTVEIGELVVEMAPGDGATSLRMPWDHPFGTDAADDDAHKRGLAVAALPGAPA
jgi:hypothetical protein